MDITSNFTIGSTEQLVSNKSQSNSDLSMDDFLQIMAAAIKMPAMSEEGGGSSSGGSTDYMAQMIQFSTMEQLKDLTESMNTTMLMTQQQQALAMIGKTVTVTGEASIVTGVVDKVKFSNGFATLMIGGKEYYLNDVQSIGE